MHILWADCVSGGVIVSIHTYIVHALSLVGVILLFADIRDPKSCVRIISWSKFVTVYIVKAYIYSPDIPIDSVNCVSITPGIGAHSFIISSPWGQCSVFSAAEAIHMVSIFFPTWFLLPLGGQKGCGFKTSPRLLRITYAAGIEPQTPRSQVQHHNHFL